MPLPDIDDVKAYLKIESGAAEDDLLTQLLVIAFAAVQAYVRRPIISDDNSRTVYIERPEGTTCRPVTVLDMPTYPIAAATTLTDSEGTVLVDGVDYRIDLNTGRIRLLEGGAFTTFSLFPYTFTAFVGLDARDDYATAIEPVLFGAILDLVADMYQRRNPNATSETTGGGVSTSYQPTQEMTERACKNLRNWRMLSV